jgi:hypothetical protein
MGLLTALRAITITGAEKNSGQASVFCADPASILANAQSEAMELTTKLKNILSGLPAGDPNIATINATILSLN